MVTSCRFDSDPRYQPRIQQSAKKYINPQAYWLSGFFIVRKSLTEVSALQALAVIAVVQLALIFETREHEFFKLIKPNQANPIPLLFFNAGF
ncbi:MAG: hypothetical protein CTY34_00120 [Methylobacter sp.]|nr:MAG: hypothetical protein CTY34_00120 [Methylobacter sp.]PPD05012.1 MAG: hypothetical protein CTY29_03265 [Methylobacter sp.]